MKTGTASDTARWQAAAGRNVATEDPADIEPQAGQMDGIGLTAYILASRIVRLTSSCSFSRGLHS